MQAVLKRVRTLALSTEKGWTVRHSSIGSHSRTIQPVKPGIDCKEPEYESVPVYTMYSNKRRFQSFGLTAVALGQAAFWGSASNMSSQMADPVLGPTWTIFGFGLSGAFGMMVTAYLRRMVYEVQLLNGPVVRVTPHTIAGMLGYPVDIAAEDIIPGPQGADPKQRHWTFGVKSSTGRTFYYILDMKVGVVDRDGLAAVVKGGDHFMAWSLKRDAEIMKRRWQQWRNNQQAKK